MIVQFCLATIVREVWSDRFKPKERPGRQDYMCVLLMSRGSNILKNVTYSAEKELYQLRSPLESISDCPTSV